MTAQIISLEYMRAKRAVIDRQKFLAWCGKHGFEPDNRMREMQFKLWPNSAGAAGKGWPK